MTKRSFIGPLSKKLSKVGPAPLVPRDSAGVAVVLRVNDGEEQVLLIKRAERKDDPWSGQIAFPGGRVDRTDTSFEETAKGDRRRGRD